MIQNVPKGLNNKNIVYREHGIIVCYKNEIINFEGK